MIPAPPLHHVWCDAHSANEHNQRPIKIRYASERLIDLEHIGCICIHLHGDGVKKDGWSERGKDISSRRNEEEGNVDRCRE